MLKKSLGSVALVVVLIVAASLAVTPAYASGLEHWGPPSGIGIGNFTMIFDQPIEFQFQYNGGNVPVKVLVGDDPIGSVRFNVYDDQQWQGLVAGNTAIAPVGRGTANAYEEGSLFWRGQSSVPGVYHVQVFPTTAQPTKFWIALADNGATGLTRIWPSGTASSGPVIVIPSQQHYENGDGQTAEQYYDYNTGRPLPKHDEHGYDGGAGLPPIIIPPHGAGW